MNKSLKVVSSVAIAGMLALNVLNPITLAKSVDDKYDTRLAGIYKGMAQFVLANKNDYVTYREIANSGKFTNVESFKGAGVPSNDNELVKTGDKFVADGKEYTVVVYGEVNKDADRLTQDDALKILKHFTGSSKMTNAAELEAANVDRTNDRITQDDALQVLKYFTGSTSTLIKGNLPHDEIGDEEDQNFTIEFIDEYINNVNENALAKAKVKMTTPVTLTGNCILRVDGRDKSDGTKKTASSSGFAITENLNETAEINLPNLIPFADGTLTVSLVNNSGKVIRKATITKSSLTTPTVTNIKTVRKNSTEATISMDGYGDKEISKIYYDVSTTNPGSTPTLTINDNTKYIDAINNSISGDVEGITAEHEIYYMTYVVEDIYGTRTTPTTAIIAKEEATQVEKINSIVSPDLTASNANAKFILKDSSNNNKSVEYIANVYKDDVIIDVMETADSTPSSEVDIGTYIKNNGAGKYKVSVVVKGNPTNDTVNSEATPSGEVEVLPLSKVTGLTLVENNGDLNATWTDNNSVDVEYEADLYFINASTGAETPVDLNVSDANTNSKVCTTKTTGDMTISTKDTIYYAKVKAMPKSLKYAASTEETSNQKFVVGANPITIASSTVDGNTATLTINNIKSVKDLSARYTLKVYTVTGKDGNEEGKYTFLRDIPQNDLVVTSNSATIDVELDNTSKYIFRFVENIGDAEIISAFGPTATGISSKIVPQINNSTITTTYNDAKVVGSNKISLDNFGTPTKIAINGQEFAATDSMVTNIRDIVKNLKDTDVLTINGENINIVLNNNADTRAFANTLADKNVTIECNTRVGKTLTATANVTGASPVINAPKSVILKGNGAIYTISGLSVSNVTVDSGVSKVTAAATQALTLNPNCNVAINRLTVSNTAKTSLVVADANTANVTANTETNTLGFTTNGALALTITGLANHTSVQNGTININAAGASINASNVNVQAQINVTSSTGTVTLTDEKLNGNKKVTVSNNATVTYVCNENTPIALTNLALRNYTNEELIYDNSDPQNVVGISGVTESNVEEVKDFIDLMRSIVTNNNAKITTTGNKNVTITLNN